MVYTALIDDKPTDDIICSLHCVGVGAKVGIIDGDLDGDLDGSEEEIIIPILAIKHTNIKRQRDHRVQTEVQ